ncbi:hypothetical protein ACGFY3_25860 [Streptomyces mirabilis]|uniref:hypothetical protein n=1 Tax=Streptomyces mirabilis TaxID=68239 RepID=UPI003710ABC1
MNTPAATVSGGAAGLLAVMTEAPWWSISGVIAFVTVVGSAQQLVNAWNTLQRGLQERRALRAAEPADVLAYLSNTYASDGSASPTDNLPTAPPPLDPG